MSVFRRDAAEAGPPSDAYRAALLRLTAHLHWLAACPPELASADGRVDPDEVKLLQRLYKALDLDADAVFSDLHAQGAGEPAVKPAGAPAAAPADTVQLDPDRIRRIQADAAKVSGVLGAIFSDEAPPPEPPPPPEPEPEDEPAGDDRLAGLDPAHRELLRELLTAESWTRSDVDALARSLDLMPDGAIETINEWAFDRFDEAVLEDGDPLAVNAVLLPQPEPEPVPHV